jgi:hypothetical protein
MILVIISSMDKERINVIAQFNSETFSIVTLFILFFTNFHKDLDLRLKRVRSDFIFVRQLMTSKFVLIGFRLSMEIIKEEIIMYLGIERFTSR